MVAELHAEDAGVAGVGDEEAAVGVRGHVAGVKEPTSSPPMDRGLAGPPSVDQRLAVVHVAVLADAQDQVAGGVEHGHAVVQRLRGERAGEVVQGEPAVPADAPAGRAEPDAAVEPLRALDPAGRCIRQIRRALGLALGGQRHRDPPPPELSTFALPAGTLTQGVGGVARQLRIGALPSIEPAGGRQHVEVVVLVDADAVQVPHAGHDVLADQLAVLVPDVDFAPALPAGIDGRHVGLAFVLEVASPGLALRRVRLRMPGRRCRW